MYLIFSTPSPHFCAVDLNNRVIHNTAGGGNVTRAFLRANIMGSYITHNAQSAVDITHACVRNTHTHTYPLAILRVRP